MNKPTKKKAVSKSKSKTRKLPDLNGKLRQVKGRRRRRPVRTRLLTPLTPQTAFILTIAQVLGEASLRELSKSSDEEP